MGGGGGGSKKRKVSAIASAEPKTLQQLTDDIKSIELDVALLELELSAVGEGGGGGQPTTGS